MCVFSRANATPSSASSGSTTTVVTATTSSASSNTSSASSGSSSSGLMTERATSVLSQAQAHLHDQDQASTPAAQEVAEIEHFAEQLVGHMAKDHHEQSSQNATNPNHSDHTTFHPISGGLQV